MSDLEAKVWHVPPSAEGLPERLEALLAFANATAPDAEAFIHPIVRAILVRFWLGYEHPFRDGNGRIARALYYWCMLRHGYEMAEFLSISGPIDRSPHAYYLAFSHTESDNGDLTYFILHQLRVMREALDNLTLHLEHRAARMRDLPFQHRIEGRCVQHAVRHEVQRVRRSTAHAQLDSAWHGPKAPRQ